MDGIAATPAPPYYAVIFTSVRGADMRGYAAAAREMETLASRQSGFLGFESTGAEIGITVSYWRDLESVKNWKCDARHLAAQKRGRAQWYADYRVRIARVEREYGRAESCKTDSAVR